MKGKLFTEIQFKQVVSGKKTSFWEMMKEGKMNSLPKYKESEILYLKEPYKRKINKCEGEDRLSFGYKYGSSHSDIELESTCNNDNIKWENKLFMPEVAARYFIQILTIRKEMLENIDCCDCIENGLAAQKCHKNIIGHKSEDIRVWIYEFRLIASATS